jgi:hypothetical protein
MQFSVFYSLFLLPRISVFTRALVVATSRHAVRSDCMDRVCEIALPNGHEPAKILSRYPHRYRVKCLLLIKRQWRFWLHEEVTIWATVNFTRITLLRGVSQSVRNSRVSESMITGTGRKCRPLYPVPACSQWLQMARYCLEWSQAERRRNTREANLWGNFVDSAILIFIHVTKNMKIVCFKETVN